MGANRSCVAGKKGIGVARIRTIKPEFPQSETIGALSRDARLLFVQLWTIADDAGRLRGASRMLASLLYPYDDDAPKLMPKWLAELEDKGCIRRYEIDGSQYVEIVNWLKHQKIDRPSESRIPQYSEEAAITREGSRALDADLGPSTGTSTKDRIRSVADATRPNPDFEKFKEAYPKRGASNPWQPARQLFEQAVKDGHDPETIIAAARGYREESDRNKITSTDKVAQAQTWLRQKRYLDYQAPSVSSDGPIVPSEDAVKFFKAVGRWHRDYGPEPGQVGCRAPADILERHGFTVSRENEEAA